MPFDTDPSLTNHSADEQLARILGVDVGDIRVTSRGSVRTQHDHDDESPELRIVVASTPPIELVIRSVADSRRAWLTGNNVAISYMGASAPGTAKAARLAQFEPRLQAADGELAALLTARRKSENIGIACPMPWTALDIATNGSVSSCCLVQEWVTRADGERVRLQRDRIMDAWQSADLDTVRADFRAGRRNRRCRRCWDAEESGHVSKRLGMLSERKEPVAALVAGPPKLEMLGLNLGNALLSAPEGSL